MLEELVDRYGAAARAGRRTSSRISQLRRVAQKAGLGDVVALGPTCASRRRILPDSMQVRLQRMYPGSKYHAAPKVATVPLPRVNGEPLDDADLIELGRRPARRTVPREGAGGRAAERAGLQSGRRRAGPASGLAGSGG